MKSLFGFGSVLLLLVSGTGACFEDKVVGENPVILPDGGVGGGQACKADSDCATGEGCAYLEADACSATGVCVAEAQTTCLAYEAGCGCDGVEFNIGCTPYPQGYASKPLAHVGSCGTTSDAGPPASGCTTNSDCATGEGCAYLAADACSATGQCVSTAQVVCNAFSPGCACDGSEINVACTPYPQGYVSKPLAHDGQCGTTIDAGPPAIDGGATGDGGVCVDVPAPGTAACTTDSDCALIATGTFCSRACICPDVPATVAQQAAFQQQIAGLTGAQVCDCAVAPVPTCVNGACAAGM